MMLDQQRHNAVRGGGGYSVLALLLCLSTSAMGSEPPRLIGGFGAEGDEEHARNFAGSGLTAQFLCVRLAPQMTLSLDDAGRVVGQIPPETRQSYIDRANMAAAQGIDIYLVTAFFGEYVKQLEALGPYTRAFVQGPTRYISPGEKSAPGPLEERYWLGQLLCEARFAAELSLQCPNVKGFLIDVEMYGGDIMWRLNSSFDDQVFATVTAEMIRRDLFPIDTLPATVDRVQRYAWLQEKQILASYFAIQEELVTGIARRFRAAIDAINPDLHLGMLPYETIWFYDGWLRGLASERAPVLVCSEAEYTVGYTPSIPARLEYLDRLGIAYRYVPGLFLLKHSPEQLRRQAQRCLQAVNGYWLFTTYSLWQPDPTKLRGPYWIQASRDQYWDALAAANGSRGDVVPDKRYVTPGATLLTGNRHYLGSKADRPLRVNYDPEPDVLFYEDPHRRKLFDGAEEDPIGTVAWHAVAGEAVSVVVDLSQRCRLDRIRLVAAHILANYPSVVDGSIEILTSVDGEGYYPLTTVTLLDGRGKDVPPLDFDDLGITARYVKIVFRARHVITHSVWTFSELAAWGQ